MSKLNSLLLLIKSLSKGERRLFKLSSALQQGDKDYLHLFNCIENNLDLKDIKKAFLHKKPAASFDITCNYLYKLLLDGMLHVREEKNLNIKLTTDTLKAKILFEKGLYEEGFRLLQKVQARAAKFELYTIELEACIIELDYICTLNFHTISEAELIQKQMKIQSLLKYLQHNSQHAFLYQLLHHRLLYKGNVRTPQQKEELNDLLISELSLVTKSMADTFNSQKTHLLFQAYYFININDYKLALKTFYELNLLFEQHNNLWAESPIDYLLTIEGVLESLRNIKSYEEMAYFIDKLKHLKGLNGHDDITLQRIIYTYTIVTYLDNGDFVNAERFDREHDDTLFKSINLLDLGKQAELYLYRALTYLGLGKVEKANSYLNQVLFESKVYYYLPVYRTFRLIHLLVHYELGNHDYVKYEIRSIKRSLTGNNRSYLLEKIIFQFVSISQLPADNNTRLKLWKKFKTAFDKIETDKYEIQILSLFNFKVWIEAKLCKKPFDMLLLTQHTVNELPK